MGIIEAEFERSRLYQDDLTVMVLKRNSRVVQSGGMPVEHLYVSSFPIHINHNNKSHTEDESRLLPFYLVHAKSSIIPLKAKIASACPLLGRVDSIQGKS